MISKRFFLVSILSIAAALHPALSRAAEAALQDLWHRAGPDASDHSQAAADCAAFCEQTAGHPLAVVGAGLRSWHLLSLGQKDEARRLLETLLTDDATPLRKAATGIAQAWLTRLDLQTVKAALQRYYRAHVEYPPGLDALRSLDSSVPLTDRWGRDWSYRQTGFSTLRGMSGQRFEVSSPTLGADSELAAALAAPYAGSIEVQATGFAAADSSRRTIRFAVAGSSPQTLLLQPGTRSDSFAFPFMGDSIIVLADRDYWLVLPRPRATAPPPNAPGARHGR